MTPADIEWTINSSCSYSYVDRANVTGRGTMDRRNLQVERLWPSALAFVSLRAVYTVSNYNCLYGMHGKVFCFFDACGMLFRRLLSLNYLRRLTSYGTGKSGGWFIVCSATTTMAN